MYFFRQLGMYLSVGIINTAHIARYWLSIMRGEEGSQEVRVIVVDELRVLLVSHWYAPFTWTLPGGAIDSGETPEMAAVREVYEETGLVVHSIAGEIGTYRGSMGERDLVTVVYTGDFTGSIAIRPNLEIMGRSWFDIDNLPDEISPANRRRIEAYRDGVRGERKHW